MRVKRISQAPLKRDLLARAQDRLGQIDLRHFEHRDIDAGHVAAVKKSSFEHSDEIAVARAVGVEPNLSQSVAVGGSAVEVDPRS